MNILKYTNSYGYIYMIRNKVNDKKYIGQTTNKKGVRGSMTLDSIKNRYWSNPHFIRSVKLYRIENFERLVIDSAKNQEELDKKEIFYIEKYKTLDYNLGYNIQEGGSHGKHSEKTKRKMSKVRRNKTWEEIFGKEKAKTMKEEMSENTKKMWEDEEHRKKMSEIRKGKSYEELYGEEKGQELRKKRSETKKGKTWEERYGEERAKELKEEMSMRLKGNIPWNKGMNKQQMEDYRNNKEKKYKRVCFNH